MQAKSGGKRPPAAKRVRTAKAPMKAPRPSQALNRRNAAAKGTAKPIAFAPHRPVMRSVRRRFPRFFHKFISALLKPDKAGERRLFKRAAAFSGEREPGRGAEPFARAPKYDAICFQILFGEPARAAYTLRSAQGILQDRRGRGMPIKPNPRCPCLLPAVPGRSSP